MTGVWATAVVPCRRISCGCGQPLLSGGPGRKLLPELDVTARHRLPSRHHHARWCRPTPHLGGGESSMQQVHFVASAVTGAVDLGTPTTGAAAGGTWSVHR